ncbi:hypothetical protein D9615_004784 [Tricholomella constricta]|uniref:Retrotransposon gag domain-containing protein n=1 Tax=Tricholomella constricta TaxID=117010 RepID=A0A8H5M6N7_9AGAR|nr:hypothetical protein D9615_004784 [Tricholomella constricta]
MDSSSSMWRTSQRKGQSRENRRDSVAHPIDVHRDALGERPRGRCGGSARDGGSGSGSGRGGSEHPLYSCGGGRAAVWHLCRNRPTVEVVLRPHDEILRTGGPQPFLDLLVMRATRGDASESPRELGVHPSTEFEDQVAPVRVARLDPQGSERVDVLVDRPTVLEVCRRLQCECGVGDFIEQEELAAEGVFEVLPGGKAILGGSELEHPTDEVCQGNSRSRSPTLTDRSPTHTFAPDRPIAIPTQRSDPSVGVHTYSLPVVSPPSLRAPDADPDDLTPRLHSGGPALTSYTHRSPTHTFAPDRPIAIPTQRSDPSVGVHTYSLPVASPHSPRAPDADPDHPTSRRWLPRLVPVPWATRIGQRWELHSGGPALTSYTQTRRSRPISLRAETRVCYMQPVQRAPAPIVAQSHLEMSDFGEFDTPPSPAALTPEERLVSLETAMSALSQSNTTNSATMDRIAALLDTIVSGNPSAASPAAPTTPATPAQPLPTSPPLPRSGSHIRPSPPPVYDGARSGGRAFWNACQLYFSLSVGQFADDHARISWVLSYMQHGRAADFVGRVFQYGSVKRAFSTWKDFTSNFEKEFFLFDEVADAALTLESTAYFQNGRTIDEYIDSFKALWIKADYPDGRHLVLKFRRGMDLKLSRRLGSITTGRPDDSKIEDWLAIARSQDFIMRTEEDFHHRSAPTVPTASRPTAPIPMPVVAPMLRWRPTAPPTAPESLWTSIGSADVLFRTTPVIDASSQGTSGATAQSALTCATSCQRNWMS